MHQILQHLGSGETMLAEVPAPGPAPGRVLLRTRSSLVSLGTERMLLDFGRANWLEKARQHPDKVRQVLRKIRTDGLFPAWEAVRSKLAQPIPLGYCNVGEVLDMGKPAARPGFAVGNRVISNGPHAEIVSVPHNLCAKVPAGVTDEEAAFTVVGAIGLQGLRLLQPTLGESFAVIGLGVIGLLAVQMLRAHGCRVLGIDVDGRKCALAQGFGAEAVDLSRTGDPTSSAEAFSQGQGMDGVLITAATSSTEPVHQAAAMCRKRGRIVLVGVTGLVSSRADFYEKELSFQVSCSYGPGRYDESYEQQGNDYPFGFVRWTEQRNFQAVLHLFAEHKLDVRPLISHRFAFAEALKAYEIVAGGEGMGIILSYGTSQPGQDQADDAVCGNGEATVSDSSVACASTAGNRAVAANPAGLAPRSEAGPSRLHAGSLGSDGHGSDLSADCAPEERNGIPQRTVALEAAKGRTATRQEKQPVVALIGAGNFTGQILLPALAKKQVRLKTIISANGVSGTHLGRKFGFEHSGTDATAVFADPEVEAVIITTRHDSHARLVIQSLAAGKKVYVEKPLCLDEAELDGVHRAWAEAGGNRNQNPPWLMVGFNRRFAPQVVKIRELLAAVTEPKAFIMTVNAGSVAANHWTRNARLGGGRLMGESCHFIDLLRHLAGCRIARINTAHTGPAQDTASLALEFEDGSIGSIHYFTNGHRGFPKERLEVFCSGRILQLDNFRRLAAFGWPGFSRNTLWRQDKGHEAEMRFLADALTQGKSAPVPFDEIAEVTRASFAIAKGSTAAR